jgi:hypothetical protein
MIALFKNSVSIDIKFCLKRIINHLKQFILLKSPLTVFSHIISSPTFPPFKKGECGVFALTKACKGNHRMITNAKIKA